MATKELEEKKSHSHDGHRKRVKERVKRCGLGDLYDHELLELLLFYGIPRRDTNQLAHDVLDHFGSIRELMDADISDIESMTGVGENAAILIHTIREMMIRYVRESETPTGTYESFVKVVQYIRAIYFAEKREVIRALLFDKKMKLIDTVVLGTGTNIASEISFANLADAVVHRKPAAVILVHNHPSGDPTPSLSDHQVTRQAYELLDMMSVVLIEHVIYTERHIMPIMRSSMLYNVEGMCAERLGESFVNRFFHSVISEF